MCICHFYGRTDVPAELRVFSTELGLMQHLRNEHGLYANYTCSDTSEHPGMFYCNNCFTRKKWRKRFHTFAAFRAHFRNVHGVELRISHSDARSQSATVDASSEASLALLLPRT